MSVLMLPSKGIYAKPESEGEKFICYCGKQFKRKCHLNEHMRIFHNDFSTSNTVLHQDRPYKCSCGKKYKYYCSLNKHKRLAHSDLSTTRISKILCPVDSCDMTFYKRKDFRDHVQEVHCVTIEVDVKHFNTLEDFEIWKEDTEKQTKSSYVKTCTKHLSASNVNAVYYVCHRSGFYVPNSTGKRKPKTNGSKKINAACPSSIEVKKSESGVEVQFWKTHFGHDYDIAHISKEKSSCNTFKEDTSEGDDGVDEIMEITEVNEVIHDSFGNECEVYSDEQDLSDKISHEDGLKALETALSYVEQQEDATPADILMLTRLRNLAAKKIGNSMKPKTIRIFFYENLKS